jgi:molybdopterin/thiamine biosynthesis adenylyltransferase
MSPKSPDHLESAETPMSDEQLLRYSRHILLPDIGIEGQTQFLRSHVLILGLGGLGSPAAMYLASSGVGHLTLVDFDHVELTNLQRQIVHTTARIGHSKVDSAKAQLLALNPDITIDVHAERATPQTLNRWLEGVDVVIDAVDNFATRHMLNRACLARAIPWVSAGAIGMDAQITVFDPRTQDSPCYACLFPPEPAPQEVSCASMGVLAPLVGVIGALQALEALKLMGLQGQTLVGRLLMLSAKDLRLSEMRMKRQANCAVCSPFA